MAARRGRPVNRAEKISSDGAEPQVADRAGSRRWREWLVVSALLLATFAAYQPAWHGGMLWDDDKHVTSAELRSVQGLARIWFDLGATQQYYPVVHSAFWIQHRLWGDATLGYHLVNILLHVISAWLLLIILRRLKVPGAVLAAAIFALHPVQVESVAWITELKNTLSGVFYLASALAYLRFDQDRARRFYALSVGLFVFALLTKSVTATLPGALLVVLWWQRGRLTWRHDIVPTIPLFAMGATAGLFTAWVERTIVGAGGGEFQYTLVERGLIAGRAIWFYLGTLCWPSNLIFIYPRWQISQSAAPQYVYPLGVAVLLVGCWLLRTRSRAPLAALLVFGGTLFPVLGFFNVFPFRFSFVADHFQYLASIPVIVLFSAGAARLARHWFPRGQWWMALGATLAVAGVLGALTWNQSHQYADVITLYRATLQANPSSWLVRSNLGALLRESNPDEALVQLSEAVRLKPDLAEAHFDLGNLLKQTGRLDEAVGHYHEAIRLMPNLALAHYNLANTLSQMGRLDEANVSFAEAIRLAPNYALAHSSLGRLLLMMGRPEEALREAQTAVRLQPDLAVVRYDLAGVLQSQGRFDEALAQYNEALRLRPDEAEIHNDMASALQQMGRFDEARAHYQEATRLSPDVAMVHSGLGSLLQVMGRLDEAARECETAVRLQPDLAVARYDLGNVRQQQGRFEEAVSQYAEALRLEPDVTVVHFNLGTALQKLGRVSEAQAQFAQAFRLTPSQTAAHNAQGSALEAQGRLREARQAYERALQAGPGLAETRQNLARIDEALRVTAGSDRSRRTGDAR